MPENDTAQQPAPWVQPTREELLEQVRDILVEHPERHKQDQWLSEEFGTSQILNGVDVARLVAYAGRELPDYPEDETTPICGTQGCIAGWTGILGSPPGTTLSGVAYGRLPVLNYPDGYTSPGGQDVETIDDAAARLLDLNYGQKSWLFAGERSREELIEALETLMDQPDADLDELRTETRTFRVTVTEVETGEEMWTRDFTNERDRDDSDWDWVEEVLEDAHNQH